MLYFKQKNTYLRVFQIWPKESNPSAGATSSYRQILQKSWVTLFLLYKHRRFLWSIYIQRQLVNIQ